MQTLAGCSFHKCATSKTLLGTLNSQEFPAIGHPTRALSSSLQCSTTDNTPSTQFQNTVQHHATPQHSIAVRPEPPPLCDGTSLLHSNTHSNTWTLSFQLVFQSRVRSGRSRRCVINKRKRALRVSNDNVRMHGTDRRFHTRTETQSLSPTSRFRSSLVRSRFPPATNVAAQLVLNCTNTCSHNSSVAGQLAPKPVDVFGPTAPRVRLRFSSCCSPSRQRRGFAVCTCTLRPPLR